MIKAILFAFVFGMVEGWILTSWYRDNRALKTVKKPLVRKYAKAKV